MNRRVCATGISVFLLFTAALCAAADPPGGTVSNLLVATATIEKIDMTTREVTLKGEEDAPPVTIIVGPDVRNLDQLRVGDIVTFTVSERVEIFAVPPGTSPSITDTFEDRRTPLGKKPGRSVTSAVQMTVTVEALGPATHTAVMREQSGELRTIRVNDWMNLDGIKVGDQVVIRHTQAATISVENP